MLSFDIPEEEVIGTTIFSKEKPSLLDSFNDFASDPIGIYGAIGEQWGLKPERLSELNAKATESKYHKKLLERLGAGPEVYQEYDKSKSDNYLSNRGFQLEMGLLPSAEYFRLSNLADEVAAMEDGEEKQRAKRKLELMYVTLQSKEQVLAKERERMLGLGIEGMQGGGEAYLRGIRPANDEAMPIGARLLFANPAVKFVESGARGISSGLMNFSDGVVQGASLLVAGATKAFSDEMSQSFKDKALAMDRSISERAKVNDMKERIGGGYYLPRVIGEQVEWFIPGGVVGGALKGVNLATKVPRLLRFSALEKLGKKAPFLVPFLNQLRSPQMQAMSGYLYGRTYARSLNRAYDSGKENPELYAHLNAAFASLTTLAFGAAGSIEGRVAKALQGTTGAARASAIANAASKMIDENKALQAGFAMAARFGKTGAVESVEELIQEYGDAFLTELFGVDKEAIESFKQQIPEILTISFGTAGMMEVPLTIANNERKKAWQEYHDEVMKKRKEFGAKSQLDHIQGYIDGLNYFAENFDLSEGKTVQDNEGMIPNFESRSEFKSKTGSSKTSAAYRRAFTDAVRHRLSDTEAALGNQEMTASPEDPTTMPSQQIDLMPGDAPLDVDGQIQVAPEQVQVAEEEIQVAPEAAPVVEPTPEPAPEQAPPSLRAETDFVELETVQQVVQTAIPGAKAEKIDGGYSILLPNKKRFKLEFHNRLPISERDIDSALAQYELPNTERNRERMRRARGSFTISTEDGLEIDGIGIIRLAERLKSNGQLDETFRHESFHMARQLGLISKKEFDVLRKKYAPDAKDEASAEELIARASEAWEGKGGLRELLRELFDRLISGLGLKELNPETAVNAFVRGDVFSRKGMRQADAYQARASAISALSAEGEDQGPLRGAPADYDPESFMAFSPMNMEEVLQRAMALQEQEAELAPEERTELDFGQAQEMPTEAQIGPIEADLPPTEPEPQEGFQTQSEALQATQDVIGQYGTMDDANSMLSWEELLERERQAPPQEKQPPEIVTAIKTEMWKLAGNRRPIPRLSDEEWYERQAKMYPERAKLGKLRKRPRRTSAQLEAYNEALANEHLIDRIVQENQRNPTIATEIKRRVMEEYDSQFEQSINELGYLYGMDINWKHWINLYNSKEEFSLQDAPGADQLNDAYAAGLGRSGDTGDTDNDYYDQIEDILENSLVTPDGRAILGVTGMKARFIPIKEIFKTVADDVLEQESADKNFFSPEEMYPQEGVYKSKPENGFDEDAHALQRPFGEVLRESLLLSGIPSWEHRRWSEELKEVEDTGSWKNARFAAMRIIDSHQPGKDPQTFSVKEAMAHLYAEAQARWEAEKKLDDYQNALAAGDEGAAELIMNAYKKIVDDINILTEAGDMAGSAAGYVLAHRRMLIGRNMDLVGILSIAEKNAHRKLAPEETEAFRQLVEEVKDLRKKLKEDITDVQVRTAEHVLLGENKKAPRAKQTEIDQSLNELAQLLKDGCIL